jgi:uncharacterized protein YjbI with pentapeptide repeats
MLIEHIEFSPTDLPPELAEDHVFRFCKFDKLGETLASMFDATFLSCSFKECEFYWTLFTVALFFECKFENCSFRGVSFADCHFVECHFEGCAFTKGNIGGPCTSEKTIWYGCTHSNCTGLESVWRS